jgi:hypothetical protein
MTCGPVGRPMVIAVFLAFAIGCVHTPTEPSWDGQVRVTGVLRDVATETLVSGARVTIGEATATTDATGFYSLTVLAGAQHVSVDGESIADVTMKDRSYRGDFYVHVHEGFCTGAYGTVIDSETRQPIAGAVLTGEYTATSDQTGWFVSRHGCSSLICFGTAPISTIRSPGYRDLQTSFNYCRVNRADFELTRN